jgi:hypothetical protein
LPLFARVELLVIEIKVPRMGATIGVMKIGIKVKQLKKMVPYQLDREIYLKTRQLR